jgi:class 3 adenylate cyclase
MKTFSIRIGRGDKQSVRVQRPISLKIFSIALGLLVLMVAVTTISTRNLSQVKNEVGALAEYYIPLSHKVSRIEADVRQQIIHLERIILIQQFGRANADRLKQEQTLFDEMGKNVEAEVEAALSLVAQAAATATLQEDKLELARTDPEIQDVKRAHHHLQESVLKFLAEIKQGDREAVHVLHQVLAEERKNFDSEMQDVRRELQKFTEGSARRATLQEQEALRLNWGITALAGILGLIFASILTRSLVKPVRRLLEGTKAVEQGNLDIHIHVDSWDEIGSLTESFNHMVAELRQKERIKNTFGKYVDPRIVEDLIQDRDFAKQGEKRAMTVFFSDIAGFTPICEQLTPDGVVRLLNQYFALMSEPIRNNSGIIDKYIGDAIMAFWGPPFTGEADHARLACLAALEQLVQLNKLQQMLPEVTGLRKGFAAVNIRVGLSSGEVTVGTIGSEYSKSYTVIGDTVNLAARLETANKQYGTRLLISEETWKLALDAIEARELDRICVAGKTEPVRVFELLARKGELSQAVMEATQLFEEGLRAYRNREWGKALSSFGSCLKVTPEDAPSKLFFSRVQYLQAHPPADDWDGVWNLSEK